MRFGQDLCQQGLVVRTRLVPADVRKACIEQRRADIGVLEFDRLFRSTVEQWQKRSPVCRLVVRGASQLGRQHGEVVVDDHLDLAL
jgi:hypothetical protein